MTHDLKTDSPLEMVEESPCMDSTLPPFAEDTQVSEYYVQPSETIPIPFADYQLNVSHIVSHDTIF